MAWLTFEVNSRDGSYRERIRFAGRTLTIGRDRKCDISVGHSTVSGLHARIVRSGRRFRVEDAGSRNGVILNRIPVQSAAVHSGDTLTLGRNGPDVRLIQLNAGPAILPRIILSLLILLGTAGGVYAMRQERVEDWLSQARLWLPQYDGAKWFAAEIPVSPPAPPPEEPVDPRQPEGGPTSQEAVPGPGPGDPRTRQLPDPPTHFGPDGRPAEIPTGSGLHTPLENGTTSLPGPAEGSARDALARTDLVPPSLAGFEPKLSERYLLAGVRDGVGAGTVNETLTKANAKLRASFPRLNILLLEVPKSSLALGILRDSGHFGLLVAATEGAPGGADAESQAAAVDALIRSLDPAPAWAERRGEAGTTIPRFPPGTPILSLDIQDARMAAVGERIMVVYELVARRGLEEAFEEIKESRTLILERREGGLRVMQDLPVESLPSDLREALRSILTLRREEGS